MTFFRHVTRAVMFRSFLEWKQRGSFMTLSSQTELSFDRLVAIANSCH